MYILVFNKPLYYGTKLGHSLINPNQIRHNGIDFWDSPFDKARNVAIDIDRGLMIPLTFIGTKFIFCSRAPTPHELAECQHIDMTSIHQWDPASVLLASMSSKIHHEPPPFRVHMSSTGTSMNPHCYSSQDKDQYESHDSDSAILHDISPSLVELKELAVNAMTPLGAPRSEIPTRRSRISKDRHLTTTAENLAELWCIGLNKARATMNATTHMATRSAVLPISRRYRVDEMYGVKHLNGKFVTDTLWSDSKSLNQNTHGQIFSHKNGFAICYPLGQTNGGNIGELLDFVHDFGVPEHLTFDEATNQESKNTKFMKTIRKHEMRK